MSRRKQAKPRAVKRDELAEDEEDSADEREKGLALSADNLSRGSSGMEEARIGPTIRADNDVTMETENSVESGLNGGFGTPTSWRSSDTPDDQSLSLSPTSCATDPDADLTYTIGVTENTPYACQFCDKAFPRLSYLKRHEQVHGDQMPFKCDYCQRLFKHKRSRDRHVKLHTGDRKYRCPHCESAFSRSDHLKIHMKTHDNAKPFQCTVCNRGYNTAAALTSHMQNHKKELPTTASPSPGGPSFRCLECSAVFPTARELQMHGEIHRDGSVSPGELPLPCAFCPLFCPGPEALRQHVEQQHAAEVPGRCPHCREIFLTQEALAKHKKIHDVILSSSNSPQKENYGTKFSCGFCPKTDFSSLEVLQLHVQTMHVPLLPNGSPISPRSLLAKGGTFHCEYCTMKFPTVHALQKHTLTIHSFAEILGKNCRENVYCSQCTMGFTSAIALSEHVRTTHESEHDRKVKVATPDRSSPQHAETAPDGGNVKAKDPAFFNGTNFHHVAPLLCSQCNAAFPDFELFRTHLKTHLDAVVQKFTCPECEGEFGSEELLDAHLVSHYLATTTEYGCQCCLKLFTKPDELQKHLMDMHAHHLYRCSLCKEVFDSKVGIQVHFAVKHSNECRLFKCTSCNAVFRSEVEFEVHVKVAHLAKAQPFRCLLCDQSFATDVQLQFHLGTHKKQFSCTLCDEAFHVEFLLDKHIQSRHSGENVLSSASSTSSSTASSSHRECDRVQNLSLKGRSRVNAESDGSSTKDYKCDICDNGFASETALHSHRRQVHNVRGGGSSQRQTALSLFCAYCNESCKSRTELENHMKAHTASPSKHKCNICDEMCPSAAILAEHKLTHCKLVSGNTCVVCRLSLASEEQFYAHVQQHNCGGVPLSCVVCRQTLVSDVEVQTHAKFHLKNSGCMGVSCYPEPPVLPCCVCVRQFEVSHLIITGKQDGAHTYMCKDCFHSKGGDLRCSECKVKFESVTELEKHRTTHKKTYQCIKCQMSFETESEIQMHVASHVLQEGTNHDCRLCQKVFDSPAKLQCHLIEHTFEGCSSYACYICSSVFTSPHLIQQHMLEHGLNARPYDCSQCHQRFFFRAELENHVHLHEIPCPECGNTFSSIVNLANHRKIHQSGGKSGGSTTPLKCSLCPEAFQTSNELQQHFFRSHGESELVRDAKPNFACNECDKVFPCLSNLQGHMRIHTQGAKYTCSDCGKEFALSRNLHIHMRSHSGEKPYECPVCRKRFARKENRKAHLKSHTGAKPFMCPHCGKTFSRKCHVKEHMRIHITSTTHPCELCSDTFSSTRLLRRHLAEVHQKQYEHVCTVCGDVFEAAKGLDVHMQKVHVVRTTVVGDEEDMASSSPGHSSSSEFKDLESSECSSMMEEDNQESPATENRPCTPEVAA